MSELDPRLDSHIERLKALPVVRAGAAAQLHERLVAEAGIFRTRRHVVLTPVAAAASVVLIACLTSLVWLGALQHESRAAMAAERTPVQFVLHAEDARTVSLVGDFNDWDETATTMEKTPGGMWSVIVHLSPGPVTYSFVIDGVEWRADPAAATVRSDFGRPSSVALVSPLEEA